MRRRGSGAPARPPAGLAGAGAAFGSAAGLPGGAWIWSAATAAPSPRRRSPDAFPRRVASGRRPL
eukprot:3658245-Lingulodinium_polyedra.AAC.1